MRRLGNTLYVLSEDLYLSLDGENVIAKHSGEIAGRVPLHTLDSIYSFSYMGASPALMGKCAEEGIGLSFFSPSGKFLASVSGLQHGNVLLRRAQNVVASSQTLSLSIAKNFILGKIFNCKWVLERCLRDHRMRINADRVYQVFERMTQALRATRSCGSTDSLRGIEGDAASEYFSVFDQLILNQEPSFVFHGRNRRPPLDPINAMLSLFYTMLSLDCSSALYGAGLDPFIGFLHTDKPGRRSLALDCMEELRPLLVDRFVVSVVNNHIVKPKDFEKRENGEVRLTSSGRKVLFDAWQTKKRETITHPYLQEKISWGLVPYVQAQLLSKYIRGDIDAYPPFLWK